MHVCVVNDWFSTSAPGGFYRIQGIAEALHDLGHDTTLVCPFFATEGGAAFPEVQRYTSLFDSYVRTPRDLIRRLRSLDADVFLVELPFPWTKVLVAALKSLQGKRVFLDFGEFWVEAANRGHFLLATTTIQLATKTASGISVTTEALRRWMIQNLRLPSDRVFYVPCGVSSEFFLQGTAREVKVGEQPSAPVIGYTGTMSAEQGCDRLVEVASRIHAERPDARFLFVGGGKLLDTLRLQTRNAGLSSSVTFTGRVSREDLPRLCAQMDIGLSVKPYLGQRTIGTFPQKIPEYMAVGCVPVSTPLQEAQNIISQGVNGVITEVEGMGGLVVALLADEAQRNRMSRAAAASARERHDWKTLVRGLVDFWESRL